MTDITVIENISETTVVEIVPNVQVTEGTLGTVELVASGPTGPQGPTGPTGPQGTAGAGTTPGGATGDILCKASNNNYDNAWKSPQQISQEGTYIGGKAVILTDVYNKDLVSYDALTESWINARAQSLVDGGNF